METDSKILIAEIVKIHRGYKSAKQNLGIKTPIIVRDIYECECDKISDKMDRLNRKITKC